MNTGANGPLADCGIVVTRPGLQAVALAHRLESLGARPIVFPTVVILPPVDPAPLAAALARLATYDFAVFVSGNAAEHVLAGVSAWPAATRAVAPGPGTAATLAARNVHDVLVPVTSYDSEGLLALPELREVARKRFIVFRGEGGRELLGDTLTARGAQVDYAASYRRTKPTTGAQVLVDAWRENRIDAITVTSNEGLDNLWSMLNAAAREHLRATPTFAPHSRIVLRARALGIREVIETAAGDAGLIARLLEWFLQRCNSEKMK
jgi:uroporphyrinogen-III synthase